ncbi:AAA family ATPase [Gorillibacterium sp. sgz5001074]|uniref:AAA family ATPase n=1 Tax=Gorillibacterium sp. sgz5001074 TaxID=3446695 RepID=UPI003F680097
MNKPHGIILFGANGSGKTTLGRELANILDFKHMDHEDYHFEKSELPYTNVRPYEDCLNLMLGDIEKYRLFVLTAVTGDFGDTIPKFYDLAVFITAPIELRMERIEQREYMQHGERIRKGGDMYEQHLKFIEFVASRSLSKMEQWAETLTCPIIHIDGTEDWHTNGTNIAKRFYEMKTPTKLIRGEHTFR